MADVDINADINVEVDASCDKCGNDLKIRLDTDRSGTAIIADVEPCDHCMTEAEDEARETGYEDGYSEGQAEAEEKANATE